MGHVFDRHSIIKCGVHEYYCINSEITGITRMQDATTNRSIDTGKILGIRITSVDIGFVVRPNSSIHSRIHFYIPFLVVVAVIC